MTGLSSDTSIGIEVEWTQVPVHRCFSRVYDDLKFMDKSGFKVKNIRAFIKYTKIYVSLL